MPRKITTIRLPQVILDQFPAGIAKGGRSQMIRATVATYCRMGMVPDPPAETPLKKSGEAVSGFRELGIVLQSKTSAPISVTLPCSEYRRWQRYSQAVGISVSKLVAHALLCRMESNHASQPLAVIEAPSELESCTTTQPELIQL